MVPFVLLAAATLSAADSSAADPSASVTALVERSEAARRAGRLDDAIRVLGGGERLAGSPGDRLRVRLQRSRCVYYRGSLAGASHDAVIAELKQIAGEAGTVGSDSLLADAKDQLGLAIYARDFRATDQAEARAIFEQALSARRAAATGGRSPSRCSTSRSRGRTRRTRRPTRRHAAARSTRSR